ncbi:MAG: class I SAM-dependent methyltransferase [Stackebrandtia sp.]
MDVGVTRLHGVRETMLMTLYGRALDARAETSILGDHFASQAIDSLYRKVPLKLRLAAADRYVIALRAKRLDGWAREFLSANPDAVVLHLGCGLDSRVHRIDPPTTVDWFDLDFPEIIDIRENLYPTRKSYRAIAASATDSEWLAELPVGRPLLMIAEGLFMYLPKSEVKALLHRLTDRYSRGQMLFDVVTPLIYRLAGVSEYRLRWGLDDPHEIERWNPNISLMDDAPVLADYSQISDGRYRVLYRILNMAGAFRNTIRPLRFTFGRR